MNIDLPTPLIMSLSLGKHRAQRNGMCSEGMPLALPGYPFTGRASCFLQQINGRDKSNKKAFIAGKRLKRHNILQCRDLS